MELRIDTHDVLERSNQLNNYKKVKLTANILFSGIGAQERGFEDSGLFDIEVLTTSDICKESVLSYAAIHCGLSNEVVEAYQEYPSREVMAEHLTAINLGYEPDKNKYYDWAKLAKKKSKELEKYWLACRLSNNLGDISRIEELPYADFWTVSFCCQDISVAGKMKGLKPDSGTRSSLLWDNIKLLEKARSVGTLPKYLMFENVKNLVSKKFINDFNDLIEVLGELGFNTYWKVINGKDCGVPQNRERVFVIAIRKDIDTEKYEFPNPFDNGLRLRDILDNAVEEKYYLSEKATRKFSFFDKSKGEEIKVAGTINPDKNIQNRVRVLDPSGISQGLRATDYKDPVKIITRNEITKTHKDYRKIDSNSIRIRKLTPKECWRLMGFRDLDCDVAIKIGIADSHLYKQAGNSIITNCVRLLAEHLYKAQYDNTYVCTDENFTRPQVD